ncbi:MAG: hypothetical protein NVS9B6_17450 [Candidatus Limnocylindrales bacterium]
MRPAGAVKEHLSTMGNDSDPVPQRLGRVERRVLQVLTDSGELTSRIDVLAVAFPELGAPPATERGSKGAELWRRKRDRAQASVSRAIASLEAKGLLVRDRNDRTGRILLSAGPGPLPAWEQDARSEEDLAAHARRMAAEWRGVASRASRRAERIRMERSYLGTEAERTEDLGTVTRLEGAGR